MADIRPFKAIRPAKGLENRIAALPYDVYNREEAKAEVEKEALSFLRIDRAETLFEDDVDIYADCVYEKAAEEMESMLRSGQFVTEGKACYYVYELVMAGRSQTGIAACAGIDDYCGNIIRKHENTRADKEVDRIRHVDTCNAHTGPIFLAYRSRERINRIVAETQKSPALYDFMASDGVTHRIWVIEEEDKLATLEAEFAAMERIYIADGHHRCASAVKVGLKRREENPDYAGNEEYNFFLSVLFPDDQLMIMDYNRVIKDLNGYSEGDFLKMLEAVFQIEDMGTVPWRPDCKGTVSMYLGHSWYRLKFRQDLISQDPVAGLDVSLLQDLVLAPLLGIIDPKTDKRIDFVGGIRGLVELERRVETDCSAAFAMYPTSIGELFAVADAELLMPPKSTWFEPKLRSGLLIHSIGSDKADR